MKLKERLVREASQEAIRFVLSALGDVQEAKSTDQPALSSRQDHTAGISNGGVVDEFKSMKELDETVTGLPVISKNAASESGLWHCDRVKANGAYYAVDPATERQGAKSDNDDLRIFQQEWRRETDELLNSVQKECNEVFERSKTLRARSSPRTVALADLSMYGDDGNSLQEDDRITAEAEESRNQDCPATESSLNNMITRDAEASWFVHPLDRSLDVTEALVRSLMGTN